jgi:predicted TIM-barrel fold metal-dependent hydrolase
VDRLKVIAIEEHFLDPAIGAATAPAMQELAPGFAAAFIATGDFPPPEVATGLGERRIADMDASGVDVQVLSAPNAQLLPADAAGLAGEANDRAAAAIAEYPDRFAAMAALATADPEGAAVELRRCVTELGFVGALITGRTEGEFLDAARFEPLLASAEELEVPLFLHPAVPPASVTAANYAGLGPVVGTRLQTSAWGWHQETAVHFLRLVMSGALDRHPRLQFILGHWGEMIPFFLDRVDEEMPPRVTDLERSFGEYFRENVYICPSGMFSQAHLRFCLELLPIERILFSVDYPIAPKESPRTFFAEMALPEEEKAKIASGNSERLFGLASSPAG